MTLLGRNQLPGDGAELTLELARRSHEPAAADRARNLAALRGRLGLPVPGGSLASASVPPQQPPLAPARSPGHAPWQQLLAVGAVTGALGFFLGLGVRERALVAPVQSTAIGNTAQQALEPMPIVMENTPLVEGAHLGPDVQPPIEPQPAVQASPARAVKPRKPQRAAARSTRAAEPSDPDFLQAVQLLSRSRRALERQEPALALGLLDELDERFSPQLLDEERAATRVLALCASGERERAVALARSWFSARPRSIYTRRLEQSCASEALRTSSR